MENKIINISTVAKVAKGLKSLKDKMIFVGGAVISLYTDDIAADEIRPTYDVDLAINLLNYGEWVNLQEKLADLGFYPNPQGHAICNYLYDKIEVDIMPSENSPLGPSNKWYAVGMEDLWQKKVEDVTINILSAPCYLATKFEAFNSRGSDYRTSHDFEDIIYVLDNRTTIVEEIKNDNELIRNFLINEFKKINDLPSSQEIYSAHIHPLIVEDRLPILLEKIAKI